MDSERTTTANKKADKVQGRMSKDERGRDSSFSEKPVRSRPRRLADWINPSGTRKVHSLIDTVDKRKNLEMAWDKIKENGRGANYLRQVRV
jgi:hypothetical protein